MTNQELNTICHAINELAINIDEWKNDYTYNCKTNEFKHVQENTDKLDIVKAWFEFE